MEQEPIKIDNKHNPLGVRTGPMIDEVQVSLLQDKTSNLATDIINPRVIGTGNVVSQLNILNSLYFNGMPIMSLQKHITDDTANNIFSVTIPQGSYSAGSLTWTVFAEDGFDDVQCRAETTNFVAVNKAGTITIATSSAVGAVVVSTSGTLTGVWNATAGTNNIVFKFKPTSSLTPTTLFLNVHINYLTTRNLKPL